ncbi:MAG: hypothetical protein FWD15_06345, partial [Alphaproteobacteria bacterium]|nr:hypothetical protein [Alphaproteobacteria bacterium]
ANHADPPSPCHSGLDPESNLKHNADSVSELRFSSGEARQGGKPKGRARTAWGRRGARSFATLAGKRKK